MSKQLPQQEAQSLRSAAQKVVDAYEAFRDAPEFSTRARNLRDSLASSSNVARKIMAELDAQEGKGGPDRAPDLPDTNRGDEDRFGGEGEVGTAHDGKSPTNPPDMAGGPPKGMTSTHSMAGGVKQNQSKPQHPHEQHENTRVANQNAQALADKVKRDQEEGRVAGVAERDDAKRHEAHTQRQDYEANAGVKQTSRRDEPGYVTGGVVQRDDAKRHQQHIEDDVKVRVSDSNPITNDVVTENVSYPQVKGLDTTNTSSDGAAKPDNYFAKQAEDGESNVDQLAAQAAQPRKYDSENRVATEILEHAAEKARQEENDPRKATTEHTSQDASPVKQTADDKEQQKFQGSRGPDVQAGPKDSAEDDQRKAEEQAEAERNRAKQHTEQEQKEKQEALRRSTMAAQGIAKDDPKAAEKADAALAGKPADGPSKGDPERFDPRGDKSKPRP